MTDTIDIAIVGAGPAGLTAAVNAAEQGLTVVLIDAGSQIGGQFWRHPDEKHPVDDESRWHHSWSTFVDLRDRLHAQQRAGNIDYRPNTQVWFIEHPESKDDAWVLHTNASVDAVAVPGAGEVIAATRLVLCPGGYDRQLPVPGWDLPGVMAAGGVQALLKGNRTLAGKRAIVTGTGPFLLSVAAGLADAGVKVVGICESGNLTGWVKNIVGAVQMPSKAGEGADYISTLIKHRVPYRVLTTVTSIEGDDEVQRVVTSKLTSDGRPVLGSERTYDVDLVATGWGFTPCLELVLAVGAETRQDVDESLVAVVDQMQRSSVDRVYVAGEATGVGGAAMAVAEGELAALGAARDAGRSVDAKRVRSLQGIIRRADAFAKAMHRAHPIPASWQEWLTPETTVCRCEEVSYSEVCHALNDLRAGDARTTKIISRAGMGWCQGRICGLAVTKMAAKSAKREIGVTDLAGISKRPLAVPVNLGDLATTGLVDTGSADQTPA